MQKNNGNGGERGEKEIAPKNNYAEKYLKEYIQETIASLSPGCQGNALFNSLLIKRIRAQLSFDVYLSEKLSVPELSGSSSKDTNDLISSFVSNYLSPSLKSLNNPFLIKDMDKAVKRVADAIKNNETICIYGDYDVDGITSTSFLLSFLREIRELSDKSEHGADKRIFYKLPDRIKDGYGLGIEPIDEICEEINNGGFPPLTLLITVDLGITNTKEVSYANSKGIDVIICDHHEIPLSLNKEEEILPDAYAILNPKRRGDEFPFKFMPGVGIAFNFGRAIRNYMFNNNMINSCPNLKTYLDIVCLGIIADIVPMYGDNRTLTRFGLKEINNNPRHGIKELKRICGLHFDNINESDIAWKISPKINAAGRVSDPSIAVRLLTEKDPEIIYGLAQELESANRKRQALEDLCLTEAVELAEKSDTDGPVIVLKGESWHPGVIGIVSSRMTDFFNKPVLLFSGYKKNVYIGSARSCGTIDLYEYLKKFQSYFVKFGGHKMACGVTINKNDMEGFMTSVNQAVNVNIPIEDGTENNSGSYDEEIDFGLVNRGELENLMKLMSPYGFLNEQPRFLMKNIKLLNINKREYRNKYPDRRKKSDSAFNSSRCYFTLNIENSSNRGKVHHKALLFDRSATSKKIFDAADREGGFNEKIPVNGIIFEFFNKYIKIINIL